MIPTDHQRRMMELLSTAGTLQRHARIMAQATGEDFNLFQILGIGHREVLTHTPFLGELLNPAGRHGQGCLFLDLFLRQVGISDFDVLTARVKLEHHVGAVTEDDGGRIDMRITDARNRVILIENKIYAADQPNQLARYRHADPKAHLLFLTLNGRGPSDGQAVERLHLISYARDIQAWIEACRKEMAAAPTIREALSQYLHLIRHLTGQNQNSIMSAELTKAILRDEESLASYFSLCRLDREVRSEVIQQLLKRLMQFADRQCLKFSGSMNDPNAGFSFTNPLMDDHNIQITFQFQRSEYREMIFGFSKQDMAKECQAGSLLKKISDEKLGFSKESPLWPTYQIWESYRNWNDQIFLEVFTGTRFLAELEALVLALRTIADEVCGKISPVTRD